MSVDFTSIKMSLDSSKKSESKDSQSSNCSLTKLNLTLDKGQIDTIKDKSQDKERDNISEIFQPTAERISLGTAQGAVLQKPVSELTEREKMERFKKEFGF